MDLIKSFSLEEIKQMVWNHDSFRSPGSDDINLGFIKDFWDILNVELMHSYDDFQRNDKLTK